MSFQKLPTSFYENDDVVAVARGLLGKILWTNTGDEITAGKIVETEAYSYLERACHAHMKRRTTRTETLFASGGTAYVYLCYGIHHLFNVVSNKRDIAEAVLVRALEPVEGVETMMERRMGRNEHSISSGPGKLSQAMAITTRLNGEDLNGKNVWITSGEGRVEETDILSAPRIGVDYAGEDALLPWRFVLKGNKFISVPVKIK